MGKSKIFRVYYIWGVESLLDKLYLLLPTKFNLVIESKDYNTKDSIPMDQQYEIETAKLFFEQLKKDGFNVEYKLQLHNDQISKIIKNLNEG